MKRHFHIFPTTVLVSSVLVFLIVAAAMTATTFVSAAARSATLVLADTTLLSNSLTACKTPAVSLTDCSGGIAAADAYIRQWMRSTSGSSPVTFVPWLDRNSPFVQMHTQQWGVNSFVLTQILNYTGSAFLAPHSLAVSTRDVSKLKNLKFQFLLSNIDFAPDNQWLGGFHTHVHYDSASSLAIVHIGSGSQPNSFDSKKMTAATLGFIAARPQSEVWLPIILFDDKTILFEDYMRYISGLTFKPVLVVQLENTTAPSAMMYVYGIRTVSLPIWDPAQAYRHTLFFDDATKDVSALTSEVWNLKTPPVDDYYRQRLVQIRAEAVSASANDPVVGSTTAMPMTRTGDYRMCYRGECELGRLWTDALAWKAEQLAIEAGNKEMLPVIAIEGSGGLRGTGWPAGNIKVSTLWNALPFVNQFCIAKLAGATIYKIFNFSIDTATFTSTRTEFGDRLMQVNSNVKIVYNTLRKKDRLVSISIRGKDGVFRPLEHSQMYTLATNSFVCADFHPFPSWLTWTDATGPFIKGEESARTNDDTVQEIVSDFLASLKGESYNTTLNGRLANDTEATADMLAFLHNQDDCTGSMRWWDNSYKTCRSCGVGKQANEAGNGCELNILIIALPIAVLAILLVAAYLWYIAVQISKNVRNVDNAPRTPGTTIAIIFTDVENSTKLWSTAPLSMSAALETSFGILRSAISDTGSYEVKSAGDSLMIACDSPEAALRVAQLTQLMHMKAKFPRAINMIQSAESDEEMALVDDDPTDLVSGPSFSSITTATSFHGLRIRIGMATGVAGTPELVVRLDEITKGYDYFGSVVNMAAHTESVSRGGQILIDPATQRFCSQNPSALHGMTMALDGEYDLKGILPSPSSLYMVTPTELLPRSRHFVDVRKPAPGTGSNEDDGMSMSEVASSMGGSDSDEGFAHEDRDFLHVLLRPCKPMTATTILTSLATAWRVRWTDGDDAAMVWLLAKRVSKVKMAMVMQEEKRAMTFSSGGTVTFQDERKAGSGGAGPRLWREAQHAGPAQPDPAGEPEPGRRQSAAQSADESTEERLGDDGAEGLRAALPSNCTT